MTHQQTDGRAVRPRLQQAVRRAREELLRSWVGVVFAEGVPFDGESFGTAATSPLFSRLRAWERAKGGALAGRTAA